jgi:hypothetical protein
VKLVGNGHVSNCGFGLVVKNKSRRRARDNKYQSRARTNSNAGDDRQENRGDDEEHEPLLPILCEQPIRR